MGAPDTAERLVRSAERVQQIGEVLTPSKTVLEMLDALPSETWQVHPSATLFEPGCADGNFLVEVFDRKLQSVRKSYEEHSLPAGSDIEALEFHALEALASIYGADICPGNILGGTTPEEVGARSRLLRVLIAWYASILGEVPDESSTLLTAARWIVERNILVADLLRVSLQPIGHRGPEVPLVEYDWNPSAFSVVVRNTSLEEAIWEAAEQAAGMLSLTRAESADSWKVHPFKLENIPIAAPRIKRRKAQNGQGWRTG